jgi:hypothetical protein
MLGSSAIVWRLQLPAGSGQVILELMMPARFW